MEDIFKNYFGINVEKVFAHFEIISRDKDAEGFDYIRNLYLHNLATHPLREQAAKKLYVGENIIIHLHITFPRADISNIKPESSFYYPICTIEEIKRIEEPKTAADYLLKIRADAIAKNSRIARIFFSRMTKETEAWSLSGYYDRYYFDKYIDRLPEAEAKKCLNIPAGFVLNCEPNGACIKSEFGKVIVISEALRHFLYYMNVFAHHANFDFDFDDAISCLFIAIRTMLQTEAPDFDIDPRGEVPGVVHNYCTNVTEDQLQFIIGHEYAHLLLGHLEDDAAMAPVGEILNIFSVDEVSKYYTPRQQQEFDADFGSLMHADFSENERIRILNGATLFFLYLDLYYTVSDYINPSFGGVKTHPDPVERIWALRKSIFAEIEIESDNIFSDKDVLDWIDFFKGLKIRLHEDILPYHIEDLEKYSSTYLRSRGVVEKVDRFDF
ncbi:M48 family metalloprotease [Janthinobacterium sp. RA13]|uniref:M48 family metalloprotease n=1 Tax=Janthinobacterium sp. RA13 TaxID=1502762 RepID=UPI000A9FDA47|nr:M48 family metalloprotease [Janthinobacterium sp. RA13]